MKGLALLNTAAFALFAAYKFGNSWSLLIFMALYLANRAFALSEGYDSAMIRVAKNHMSKKRKVK